MTTTLSASPTERVIWVDREGGMIVDPGVPDQVAIVIDRAHNESNVALAARLARKVASSDHVYVCGTGAARVEFEREFVALTHHPERLVDVAPARG